MSFINPTSGIAIPWDDGTTDKIYVDFSTDPVEVTSDSNATAVTRVKLLTFISQHPSMYKTASILFRQPVGGKTTMVIESLDAVYDRTDKVE